MKTETSMKLNHPLAALAAGAALLLAPGSSPAQISALTAPGGTNQSSPVTATILADHSSVKPGETFTVGVYFKIQPNWHIYWTNPGATGFATSVKWGFPQGTAGGETLYPAPESFVSPGDVVSFGYADEVLLLTEAKAGNVEAGGKIHVTAKASWLMCSDRCIPGKKDLELDIPVGASAPANAALFQKYRAMIPVAASALPAGVTASASPAGNKTTFKLIVSPASGKLVAEDRLPALRKAWFFPDNQDGYVIEPPTVEGKESTVGTTKVYDGPATIIFTAEGDSPSSAPTRALSGVLVIQAVAANGKPQPPQMLKIHQKL